MYFFCIPPAIVLSLILARLNAPRLRKLFGPKMPPDFIQAFRDVKVGICICNSYMSLKEHYKVIEAFKLRFAGRIPQADMQPYIIKLLGVLHQQRKKLLPTAAYKQSPR